MEEEEEEKIVKGDYVIVDLQASLEDLYMGGTMKYEDDGEDVKSIHVSEGSSSMESNQMCNQPKSPMNNETVKKLRSLFSGNSYQKIA